MTQAEQAQIRAATEVMRGMTTKQIRAIVLDRVHQFTPSQMQDLGNQICRDADDIERLTRIGE